MKTIHQDTALLVWETLTFQPEDTGETIKLAVKIFKIYFKNILIAL